MRIAALIRSMAAAGAPAEAIAIAVEAIENAASIEAMRRASQAERKRRQRAMSRDSHGTVTGQSRDTPSPEVSEGFPTPLPNLPNPIPKKTPKGVQKGVSEGEAILIEAGCSERLLADWKSVRKAKNAGPITETVALGIGREAGKAGMTVRQAITTSCERGWQGFKAEWIDKPNARAGPIVNASRRPDTMFAALDRIFPDGPNDQAISPSVVRMLPGSG
jgi:hypothetical protein